MNKKSEKQIALEMAADAANDQIEAERDAFRDRVAELEGEVTAWRDRFPKMEYRRADECVALKFEHR